MEVDKIVLALVKNVSSDERNAIISFLQTSRGDPQTLLLLGMFRDIYVFRQMINATMIRYIEEVESLKSRIRESRIREIEKKLGE